MYVVTGSRQYSVDLPQVSLEVPFCYIFRTNDYTENRKTRKLVEATFTVKISPTSEDVPTPMETPAHEGFANSMVDLQIQTSCH